MCEARSLSRYEPHSQNQHSHSITFFFFNDTATTEIYTLSLHDALPISPRAVPRSIAGKFSREPPDKSAFLSGSRKSDRKSTRLNSSHMSISYAVFCLKKKKIIMPGDNVIF